jgi:uncharacterized membrane protein
VKQIFDSPWASLAVGLICAAALLVLCIGAAGGDALSVVSLIVRYVHVLAATVWIGLIAFVNFIHLAALTSSDEDGRERLNRTLVPGLLAWLRHASTATVAAGAVLLATTGYIFPNLVYGSGVYVPAAREILLWTTILGALAMWMFVHMYIAPSLLVMAGLRPGDAEAKARARGRVVRLARVNLIIAVPVLLGMLAAAHLF